MAKNSFFIFQKRHIVFCLLIFIIILAALFAIQFSQSKNIDLYHIKKDRSAEIKQTMEKAIAFFNSGKYDSAFLYFNKTQLLCDPKEDYADEYVGSLNYIVEILQRYTDYYEAETTLIKAFPYLDKTTNPKHAVNAYTFMAFNYYYTYDNEKALFYHKKALKKAVSTFRKSRIISEIAFIYMQQGKYKEAVDLLEPIARLKIEDKITPAKTDILRSGKLYNLGLSYFYMGNHKKEALDCFNESLEIGLTLNDDYELIGNYYAFYQYYKKYNNPVLKKINAEKAYICAKKAKSATNEINMLAALIEADNAENSKKHCKLYFRKVDSLIVSRKKAKNQFADIIYNSKKDKEENLELKNQKAENELQLQRQKNTSYISYVVISLSVFVLIFIAFYVTHKGKKEKNDAVFKSEMRISDRLHNELTKEIHQILEFAKSHKLEDLQNKEKLLSNLNDIYSKTRSISKENSVILTDENYENGLKEMISEYSNSGLNIIINGLNTFPWPKIERIKKITIFRTLQEILDTIKISQDITLASISFKRDEKNITVTYVDNRLRINNEDAILKKRLQNVENRIKTIKGTLNFDVNSENGFKISFKFPI